MVVAKWDGMCRLCRINHVGFQVLRVSIVCTFTSISLLKMGKENFNGHE